MSVVNIMSMKTWKFLTLNLLLSPEAFWSPNCNVA